MADSDNVKKEDVEIGSVLQLTPHNKNTQYANVSKPKDGEMVSLDELYEKTGQESINKFLEGFKSLTKSNKLSRAHGAALKVNGFENWLELSDELNAYKGAEGFLDAIKKGIIAIVKAIIAFVKGIADWVYTRIRSLLGFDKTVKEALFLTKNSEEIKNRAVEFFKQLGFTHFNEEEFLEGLPSDATVVDILSITKKRVDGSADSLEKLVKTSKYIEDYVKVINSCNANIKTAKRSYDSLMEGIKRKVKNNNITLADIGELTIELTNVMEERLNTNDIAVYLDNLLATLYDIEIDGLGHKNNFKQLREQIKAVSEQAKLAYNKELYDQTRAIAAGFYKNLYKGAGYSNAKLDPNIVKNLKQFLDESNSVFIQKAADQFPGSNISAIYIEFCNKITEYSSLVETVLQIAQRVEASVVSLLKWNEYINYVVVAYISQNVADIADVHEKIPKNLRKQFVAADFNRGNYKYGFDIENPGFNITEEISTAAASYLSRKEISDVLSRFKYSLLGR